MVHPLESNSELDNTGKESEHDERFENECNILLSAGKRLIVIDSTIQDVMNNNNKAKNNYCTSKPLNHSTSNIMDSSIVLTAASSSHLEDLPKSMDSEHKLDDNNMTHQTANQDVATLVNFSEPNLVEMQDVANQMTIATATRSLSMPGQMTQTHNQVIEVLSCDWLNCFLKFTTQEDLVNHVNHCHILLDDATGYCCRWVGCTRNGKRFNAKYKMRIHVRSHTNEKPHQCYLCKKCFSRSENLKIHTRSHTGEKPYICSVEGCNKRYSNSSDRFKHSRTHIVDKPYICKAADCNKCYTDPSSLRKHARSHNHYVAKPENPTSKPVKTVIPNTDIVMMYPVLPTRSTPVLTQMFSSTPQYPPPTPHMLSLLQANSLEVRPTNNTVDSTRTHDLMFNAKITTTSSERLVPRSEEQLSKKETTSILSTLLGKEHVTLFLNNDHGLKSAFKVETSHSALTSGQSSSLPIAISTT